MPPPPIPLRGLRSGRMTQEQLGEAMDKSQNSISRLERQDDMLVSTLCKYVNATGGQLHLIVEYPDGRKYEVFLHG